MGVLPAVRDWLVAWRDGWNRFWFEPSLPHTLGLIRVLGGAMICYTLLVWGLDLEGFLGPDAWVTREVSRAMHRDSWAWSHLWLYDAPWLLWTTHVAAILIAMAFTLGCCTRVTSVLTWLLLVSYAHRLEGALFGLDQINTFLAMYLMVGGCGDAYSLDRWWARRRGRAGGLPVAKVSNTVATRLIQLHLCVIYLFGGIGKMRGELWWDGSAMWYAAANYEYQSLDLTWIIGQPAIMALLTHVTVLWETFYCFLVWPKLTRPVALGLAVAVHLGIAVHLGMITFGLAMIIGNLAFVSPELVRSCGGRRGAAGS